VRNDAWGEFLGRHNITWETYPRGWTNSAFLGNGELGSMIFLEDDHTLRFELGHNRVYDHRPIDHSVGILLCQPRLPIGMFVLKTEAVITGGSMTLDLWNAEVRGTIETTAGTIDWRAFTPARDTLLVVETASESLENACRWEWRPQQADSPCLDIYHKRHLYTPNPSSETKQDENGGLCLQPLLSGGETATAWAIRREEKKHTLLVTVHHSYPEHTAHRQALATLEKHAGETTESIADRHRQWWHDYYPQSFVSLPDARWERFYWIQMYKLGCATRSDGPIIDCLGPWFQPTAWPAVWWNMNVQLAYWPVYTANRLELGESLCRTLDENMDNLIANVPSELRHDSAAVWIVTSQECRGDSTDDLHTLAWACHNYWLQYRYTMDDDMLHHRLYPLLRRAIQFIAHQLEDGEPGPDGRPVLHLRASQRGEQDRVPDNTSALALLRWGCSSLLWSCERLSIDDPLIPRWKDILTRLCAYPADDEIGLTHHTRSLHPADYLLAVYPLHLLNREDEATVPLLDRSLDFWFRQIGGRTGSAWLFTHGACMMTCSGRHAEAVDLLSRALDSSFTPNTFNHEGGSPVIEGPLSWAAAVHELLLQSWGGTIRIFPGVSESWSDVSFRELRAEGAFLVSAIRRGGKTRAVRIESLAGEPCRVAPGLSSPVRVRGGVQKALSDLGGGIYELNLQRGQKVVLYTEGDGGDDGQAAAAMLSDLPGR